MTFDLVRRWLPGTGRGSLADPGLFPPGSVAGRVNAETALLLGGGRALLLQLAHPMVAAGVADHSDFRRDAFGRLANTLDLTLTVAFGDEDQRRAAASRVTETHRLVTGSRGPRAYRALDPELLLWVHATLVDGAIVTYERFVGSIGGAARGRYHEEMKRQAVAFGIPRDRLPVTLGDFRRYVDRMVATLHVSDEARLLSRGVLDPRTPTALRPLAGLMRFVTAGLLPPRIRAAYDLAWDPRRERALGALAAAIRGGVVPVLPDAWRRWPHARDADRRMVG
ncbi:MAG TPA: oxygenase MpaB family protein [Actinomycetota bacterium]|nr:oxygenase MpaB family protein [Actinomycetota bacterium]